MSNGKPPDWYRFMDYWQSGEEEKPGSGLSFGMLVAAMRTPIGAAFNEAEDARQFASQLYEEMKATVVDARRAATYPCLGIGGTVFRLEPCDAGAEIRVPFDTLWGSSGQAITEGRFSLEGGQYIAISPRWKGIMRRALGRD